MTCVDVSLSDLHSAGSTGRRERPAAGQRSGPGTESASWRQGEKQAHGSGFVTSPSLFYISPALERTSTKANMSRLLQQRGLKRRESKQKEKSLLTLQTEEVFRSLIISTNKLPHYRDPLWTRAKVRNAPPSSKYH